jgi:hypothetical protein
MSEKTESFTPKFFLVNPDQSLCITHKMILGRAEGEIILDDSKISSKHCEFIPRLLEIFIKDLNSSNGVFVNKQKIFPDKEVKLNDGDVILIGSYEFVLCENEAKAKQLIAEHSQTDKPLKESFHLTDLVTFFSAPLVWRLVYILTLLASVASLVMHLRLDVPLPENLEMLSKHYSDIVVSDGVKAIFLVWILSLVHSFIITHALRKSQFLKLLSVVPFALLIFYFVNFADGPAWHIKHYVVSHHAITEGKVDPKPIVQLKNVTNLEKKFKGSYKVVAAKLNQQDQELLAKDYKSMLKQLQAQIDAIKITE